MGLIENTAEHVKQLLTGEGSGHDWWHVYRVWKLAARLASEEKADSMIVELSALLHDIKDWKSHPEHEGPQAAKDWLEANGLDGKSISHICDIISTMSFKGSGVQSHMKTLEGQVVQDADRLDAIGAIGIGRAFTYGGHIKRPMHAPGKDPTMHKTAEEYKNITESTINHFYEKLLLLKDRMNTKSARQMAAARHKFMQGFLDEFYREWDGER